MPDQLTNPDAWLEVFARSHVVLVHFPVGLLIIAALVEIWGALFRRGRVASDGEALPLRPSGAVVTMLTFGTIAAIVAAVSGWFFADADWKDGSFDTLWWHRWTGVAAAAVAAVALIGAVIARASSGGKSIGVFRLMLVLGAALVGLAGHYGGTMIHGENHVFRPLFETDPVTPPTTDPTPGEVVTNADAGTTEITPTETTPRIQFASQVMPIFEAECFQCHGPRRQRGELRLDLPDLLAERIAAGDLIVAGDPAASELHRRVTLPVDDFDHMPPSDESLTPEQIAIITDWISQGASVVSDSGPESTDTESAASDGNSDGESGDDASQSGSGGSEPPAAVAEPFPTLTADQQVARDAAIARINERGGSARVIAANTDAVEVDLSSLGDEFTTDDVALLSGLEDALVWLDLSSVAMDDKAVAALNSFPQIRRLNLGDTQVTDAALAHLAELPRLEVINLNGTAITDGGILTLRPLAYLQRIYLWRSQVTLTGAASLRAANPNIETVLGD